MNPFEWRGPAFLVFFAIVSIAAIALLVLRRRAAEDGEAPKVDLTDPYLLAYLRGGANEAIRVAVFSLIDRGLLAHDEDRLRWARADADRYVRRPIELAVLGSTRSGSSVSDVFDDALCKASCLPYEQSLSLSGAVPNQDVRQARVAFLMTTLGVILMIATIKIMIGLARSAPVSYLVVMAIIATVIAIGVHSPRRTRKGDRLIENLHRLFAGLRNRAGTLRFGQGDSNATMLAAVYGVGALPAIEFAPIKKLFKKADSSTSSSSSCGSSCGSGCGGGGDGGGGGCGGCGGGGD